PRTGRSRTSPAYSASIGETILDTQSSTGLTTAGMTANGSLLAQDILEAPTVDKDYLFLESPGALGEGISGANPPWQNKLEVQLKQNGSIAPREVSNPEFLEASLGLPVGWTDPQENGTAMEFLAETAPPENVVKPSETSLIPELPSSPSIASSTTTSAPLSASPRQLDLTTRIQWIFPEQVEEVSFTQIRHSVDTEAIARYTELMRDNLWDFEHQPLPVLFEHENRWLIGDGHHRIEAARKLGLKIKCEIFTAWSIEEALLYSIRAVENLNHGIPLRPKDQRKRITMFLDLLDEGKISIALPEGYQEWSARAIATYLRLPESGYRTVASIRKERSMAKEENEDQLLKEYRSQFFAPTPPPQLIDEAPSLPFPHLPHGHDLPPTSGKHDPLLSDDDHLLTSLTNEEREKRGLIMSIDMDINRIVNQLTKITNEQLTKLREAIEAEEVRRLGKILEEEKGSN
ncbi:hypothetical protein QUA05_31375, partial [Microcoleus sp. SVA1_A1]